MKTTIASYVAIASVLALVVIGASAGDAMAQPGNAAPGSGPPPDAPPTNYAPPPRYAPPPAYNMPPPRPMVRRGLTLGGDLGLGSMSSNASGLDCFNCDAQPPAIAMSAEIGAMITPRLALLLHGRWTGRALDQDGTQMLHNTMGLVAAKFWPTRRFWIKGGLGVATTTVTADDGFEQFNEELGSGGAGLLAVGFEVVHSRRFALDLALTGTSSTFDEDAAVDTGVLSLGISWF